MRRLLPALPADDLLRDRDLSPPVDVDPDQLVRRAGDDARAAAHRRGAAARQPDADGPADGDGARCPSCCSRCPSGVWLDRVRKLPVYVAGELTLGAGRSPACRSPGGLGWLSMPVAVRRAAS